MVLAVGARVERLTAGLMHCLQSFERVCDHVHRHRAGRCDDDWHSIGTSWTSGSAPDYGWPRTLRIEPSLEETDQGAGRRIATSLTLLWVIRGKVTPEIRAHSASTVGAANPRSGQESSARLLPRGRKRDYPGRSYSLIKSGSKITVHDLPHQNATPSVNRFSALLFSTDTTLVHRYGICGGIIGFGER